MHKVKTSAWVLWSKIWINDDVDIHILSITNEIDKCIKLKFGGKHYTFIHPIYAPDILKRDFPDYDFGYEEKPIEFEV